MTRTTYYGWVVGFPLSNPQGPTGWHTTASKGGIWASGFPCRTDGTSLFPVDGQHRRSDDLGRRRGGHPARRGSHVLGQRGGLLRRLQLADPRHGRRRPRRRERRRLQHALESEAAPHRAGRQGQVPRHPQPRQPRRRRRERDEHPPPQAADRERKGSAAPRRLHHQRWGRTSCSTSPTRAASAVPTRGTAETSWR